MPDYIPYKDINLAGWTGRFRAELEQCLEDFQLTEADIAPLIEAQAEFESALARHRAAQGTAKGAAATKRRRHSDLVREIRSLFRRIDGHPSMTNGIRGRMGLNMKGEARSESTIDHEIPGIYVESLPGKAIVHFGTNPQNEQKNTKPACVFGTNIYRRRDGDDRFELISFETSSPYVDDIAGPPTGHTYMVRYRGQNSHEVSSKSLDAYVAVHGAEVAAEASG